ncbi:thioredoxin family protein [Mesonia maritima]|uniref:Thioredoxin-related protein n=1 Tax=Mesonia maritima TaxID=1793873 RepID=A0ABU1K7A4_9FLAO|nr:thioredoxin family protein [Mesonia maritima]MDR6301501.1 thioredoxin-related protein [Mesonia maritima]
MKTYLIIFVLLFTTGIQAQDWNLDFEKAKKIASEEDNPIILVFQGSDWCAPCIKLDREIWCSDEFKSYAKDHFVMLKADFPRREKNALSKEQQEKNNQLAEKYNPNGYFPFVIILNKNGEILGKTGYEKMTPEKYIAHLNSFIN